MIEEFNVALASRIAAARKNSGKTQQQIADALTVHVNQYQRLEAGRHKVSVYDLTRIATAIGVAPAELLSTATHQQAMRAVLSAGGECSLRYEESAMIYARERGFVADGAEYLAEPPRYSGNPTPAPDASPPSPPHGEVVDKATAWDQCVISGQRAREKALEEAAKLVEVQWNHCWPSDIAAAIRALASAPPVQNNVMGSQAAMDVLAERLRQVSVEDFRTDEDDHYTSGEMAWAATCYLQNAAVAGKMQGLGLLTASECDERGKSLPKPEAWPWDAEWWKPSGQRRDLVKAAALIIAEIERLDRASLATTEASDV